MIKIGTDICSVERIKKAHERFGPRFARRILTEGEHKYVFGRRHQVMHSLAARFAAKEATSKALGCGWRGIGWKEIEVTRKETGEPGILLHGRAAKLAEKLGLAHFEVTLSHEREYATAFVLAHSKNS